MTKILITELQQRKLKEVFPYILSTPFYSQKLSDIIVDRWLNDPIKHLSRIPFTSKQELRFTSALERTPLDVSELIGFFSSSGTTGQPSVYAWSKDDQKVYEEISGRLLWNIGVGPGDVTVMPMRMGMSLSWYLILSEMRAVGASVVPLGAASFDEITKTLVSYPITILKTSPIIASRLFRYIEEKDISLFSKMQLRQIHLAGYFSSNARKKRLAKQWEVDCYDMYGISEFGLVSGECPAREGQHFCADFAMVEVLAPENQLPVNEGQAGIAVYTSLWKKGSPLLRYWSNDFVILNDPDCSCGLDLPKLTFQGRNLDSAVIGGNRIFARDVENVLFSYEGIADEYLVKIFGSEERLWCEVQVETLGKVQSKRLKDHLYNLIGAPIELKLLPMQTLDREKQKPIRIVDYREKSV